MIVYNFITLRKIANEIILRAKQFINAENFDWDTLVLLINRAMQEVLSRTLPYKDWAYIDTIAIAHRTILPREYLKAIRVLLSDGGRPPYREARYVDAKEWYATTHWQRHQEWNKATDTNPIYTLWGFLTTPGSPATDNARITVYLSPNTEYQTGTAPTGLFHS